MAKMRSTLSKLVFIQATQDFYVWSCQYKSNARKQYKFDVNTLRLDYTCTSNLTLNITVTQKLKSWQYQQKLNS